MCIYALGVPYRTVNSYPTLSEQSVRINFDPTTKQLCSFISAQDYETKQSLFEIAMKDLDGNSSCTLSSKCTTYLIQLYEQDIAGEWVVKRAGRDFGLSFAKNGDEWHLNISGGSLVLEESFCSDDSWSFDSSTSIDE